MKLHLLLFSACALLSSGAAVNAASSQVFQVRSAVAASPDSQPPPDSEKMKLLHLDKATGRRAGQEFYVSKKVLLDQTDLNSTSVQTNALGRPEIAITFSDKGRERFAQITRQNINKQLAVIINGQLYAAPIVRSEIPGGTATIQGSFTLEEAEDLSNQINHALPAGPDKDRK